MMDWSYLRDILEESWMLIAKPVETPMDSDDKLLPNKGESFSTKGRYKTLVAR